jgi:nitrate/nitrite transporter NarK
MSERDQSELVSQLENERIVDARKPTQSAAAALWNPTTWMLVFMYFFFISGFYGYTMWVPSVIKAFEQGPVTTGWLTAIPFGFALVGMMVNAYWSDRRMKRIAHVVIPFIIAAAALLIGQWVTDPVGKMVLLCIAAIGVYSPFGALWAVPTTVLPSAIIGVAIGLQNALGSLGGYLGPLVVGKMKDTTGDYRLGFFMLSGSLVCAAIMMLLVVRTSRQPHVTQANAVLRNAEVS